MSPVSGMIVREVTITPSMAKRMLESSKDRNIRKVNTSHVKSLASDMRAGRWYQNGETIKVSSDDHIIDGQHRLLAIIEAGIPINVLVVRVDADNGDRMHIAGSIDAGLKRTSRQMLESFGVPNSDTVAAALAVVYRVEKGGKWWGTAPANKQGSPGYGKGDFDIALRAHHAVDFYNKHKGIAKMAERVIALHNRCYRLVPKGMTTGTFYLASQIDEGPINFILDRGFFNPPKHGNDSMMIALETRFKNMSSGPQTHLPSWVMRCAYLIKAWKMYKEGKTTSVIRISYPEERLPEIE